MTTTDSDQLSRRVRVVDSHTAGEPTRVVVEGGPDLEGSTLAEKRDDLERRFDDFRRGVVLEPRGGDVWVGALIVEPCDPSCQAGVIFFNNSGYLNMCGHGMIGLVVTLAHLGEIDGGVVRIDTPVGPVTATLEGSHRVTIENVASYREAVNVEIEVEGFGKISGDVAWGGNWFFLTGDHGIDLHLGELAKLSAFSEQARTAIRRHFPEVDHIELTGPPMSEEADGRNFVLCPGLAYDRSPCGTGTSAKMACLHADGKLAPGGRWRQEGILGTVFEGAVAINEAGELIPSVSGEAFVTAESELIFDPGDPFGRGIEA